MGVAASTTGIRKIPVTKTDLLRRLEENKRSHEAEFRHAFAGYQKDWIKRAIKAKKEAEREHERNMRRVQKAIDAAQRAAESDKGQKLTKFPTFVEGLESAFAPAPVCRTADYEMAIDLFTMFQPMDKDRVGVIDLSPTDFAHYCRDNWDWKNEHQLSVANYTSAQGAGGVTSGASGAVGAFFVQDLNWAGRDDDEDEAF